MGHDCAARTEKEEGVLTVGAVVASGGNRGAVSGAALELGFWWCEWGRVAGR